MARTWLTEGRIPPEKRPREDTRWESTKRRRLNPQVGDQRPVYQVIHVARGPQGNHVHAPMWFYATLTEADGPEQGPWLLSFEIIPAGWLRNAVTNDMAYDLRRLRIMLNRRDFDTAYPTLSIGNRVALRSIGETFERRMLDTGDPIPIGLLELEVDGDELLRRFRMRARWLEVGRWYGIGYHAPPGQQTVCGCLVSRLDLDTLEFDEPVLRELTHLLRPPARAAHPDATPNMLSQAVLQSLHHIF